MAGLHARLVVVLLGASRWEGRRDSGLPRPHPPPPVLLRPLSRWEPSSWEEFKGGGEGGAEGGKAKWGVEISQTERKKKKKKKKKIIKKKKESSPMNEG